MPLMWVSLAFAAGILLGECLDWQMIAWGVITVFAVLWIGVFKLMPVVSTRIPKLYTIFWSFLPVPVPVLILFVCFGALRLLVSQPNLTAPDFIASHNDTGKEVVVRGVVIKPPDVRDTYTNLRVKTESIRYEDAVYSSEVTGQLLGRVSSGGTWSYGDYVALRGELQTPPENEEFSYRDYLSRHGIYSYMSNAEVITLESGHGNLFYRWIYRLKTRALSMVYQLWPDPEAALMAGILLGVESGIPANVQEAFENTGTSHIIVISGFNITIIAGVFVILFNRFLGRLRGALIAGFAILVYTTLVGADPAVVRAAVMGGVALIARLVGRQQDGLNTLAFTAFVMAAINPTVIWDVSFLLSIAATLGLVLYAEPLVQAFTRLSSNLIPADQAERLAKPVGEYFLLTIAAMITTMPVIIYFFQRISLISFIANPVILPVQPAVMVLGGIAVILGLIWLPLGKLAALVAWPFMAYTIRVVEFFDNLDWGVMSIGKVGLTGILLFYIVLFGLTFAGPRLREMIAERGRGWRPVVTTLGIAILGITTMFVWVAAFDAPDGQLQITLLDTNTQQVSGEAILIKSPTGRYLLINGGPSALRLSESLGRRLPFFHRQLDYLIIAGPEEGKLDGLPRVVEQYAPDEVLWAGPRSASYGARRLREELNPGQVEITAAEQGQVLELGGGAHLQVLTAGKRGAIFLLEWGDFRAVFPLGANFEDMEALDFGGEIGPVTALVLADNGYSASNPPEWLENLQPQAALLSVALNDQLGRPDDELLNTLADTTLLRTDQNGWIQLRTDGEQLWVEVEKK